MECDEGSNYKRMQVKVLYSFNNNSTVFLSRSKGQHSVKLARIPIGGTHDSGETETIMLGAFDLTHCIQQILQSSPENFKLATEDYVVYYKDVTEQPDEPFVSNGTFSTLTSSTKSHIVPGRVCQNLSASFLFSDKGESSSLTLEIRLKLHAIEKNLASVHSSPQEEVVTSTKRLPNPEKMATKRPRIKGTPSVSANAAVKATRTKSLPIFYHPHNQQIFNIMNADKANVPSRYDSKSVQERFKLAPFLQAKIIDNPSSVKKHNRKSSAAISKESVLEPQRAMRTRSMMSSKVVPFVESSPIQEEPGSDDSDDTEYKDENAPIEEDEEDENDDVSVGNDYSPYTPQQPPYNSVNHTSSSSTSQNEFQALPDLEDLDSKRTHTIPSTKLPKDHGLICTNNNCATTSSITWRYFETSFHQNYLAIHRAEKFDKKNYEGMFGPLCNACYLFLRNKGFMRPEGVVKKYLQQQKYKKELKEREEHDSLGDMAKFHEKRLASKHSDGKYLSRPGHFTSSSPGVQPGKFATPSRSVTSINQVNGNFNQYYGPARSSQGQTPKETPNYNDLNDFMNQLNSFGGPLTDIDPLPQDHNSGLTPPMMATKSNTRVINLYDDGEDKENCPPADENDEHFASEGASKPFDDIETMMVKSFGDCLDQHPSSMSNHEEWISDLFNEPTPRDGSAGELKKDPTMTTVAGLSGVSPDSTDGTQSEKEDSKNVTSLPQLRTFSHQRSSNFIHKADINEAANMPSSPLVTNEQPEVTNIISSNHTLNKSSVNIHSDHEIREMYHRHQFSNQAPESSSPSAKASRNDTTMSWNLHPKNNNQILSNGGSTPNTDIYSDDELLHHHEHHQNRRAKASNPLRDRESKRADSGALP